MNEIWKDIKDWEGYYEVSNLGNVRSCKRTITDKNGVNYNNNERILKPAKNRDGYLQVGLSKNSKGSSKFVHRLVAEAFIPNLENKPTINHKDGNKLNNNISNLEWATKSEQAIHSLDKKLRTMPNVWVNKFGSKHCASKAVIQYSKTGKYINEYGSIIEAANNLNIHPSSITKNCNGKTMSAGGFVWKHKHPQ